MLGDLINSDLWLLLTVDRINQSKIIASHEIQSVGTAHPMPVDDI